jgi:hypothetical protein
VKVTLDNNIPEHAGLITARDIADMTGASEAYIQTQMREGKIPCVKIGQKRLMTKEQYQFWIWQLEKASGFVNPYASTSLEDEIHAAIDLEEAEEIAEMESSFEVVGATDTETVLVDDAEQAVQANDDPEENDDDEVF